MINKYKNFLKGIFWCTYSFITVLGFAIALDILLYKDLNIISITIAAISFSEASYLFFRMLLLDMKSFISEYKAIIPNEIYETLPKYLKE